MKIERSQNSILLIFLSTVFGVFLGWGLLSIIFADFPYRILFFDTYWLIIPVALIVAFRNVRVWGGVKSIIGRGLFFLTLGLIAQLFGQISFSLQYLSHPEVPYPSIADIGYFGSIPLYLLGIWYIARASGATFGLRSKGGLLKAAIAPAVMLVLTFYFFLKGVELDFSSPIKTLLNYGYPLGQAMYVAGGVLALMLSRQWLGGVLRKSVLVVLIALFTQYIADASFLFLSGNGLWSPGGFNDVLYLVAYFIMALGFISFYTAYKELHHSR